MSDVIIHKCPNCDGPLLFDPKDQNFHCEYCLSRFSVTDIEKFEAKKAEKKQDTLAKDSSSSIDAPVENLNLEPPERNSTSEHYATDTHKESDDDAYMELFNCPSCGAEIVTEATTAATYCYYCHNPVVLAGRISGEFLPESVLPFAIEKEEAIDSFLNWAQKKKFIPKDFFDKSQVEKLTGVYFPYWIVDADLSGDLSANANSISVWRVGDYEYTQTKKFKLYRKGKISLTALVKNALKKNAKVKMVESVQPFPLEQSQPFHSQFLAGFQAEKRDIEISELNQELSSELKGYGNDLLEDTISGYSTVYNKQSHLQIDKQQQRYVLLPVWLVTYNNQQDASENPKPYYYAMNGATGKVSGKLPINTFKLTLFSLSMGILALIAVLIGGYFI